MTEADKDLEGVLRRVQKLLAIAQDERANPAEAAAAASQAEKIMRKFQIEHADVIRADLDRKDSMDYQDVKACMKPAGSKKIQSPRTPVWAQWIATDLAKLHDCQCVLGFTEGGSVVRFRGYKSDVQVAAWTFDYLVNAVISNVRAYQKVTLRTKIESNSYRHGFVNALLAAIHKATAEKAQDQQAAGDTSRSLVVAKAAAVASRFGVVEYQDGSPSQAKITGDAFGAGLRDGNKVDVGRRAVGTNSTGGSALLLK